MKRGSAPVRLTPEQKKTFKLVLEALRVHSALTPNEYVQWKTCRAASHSERKLRGIDNWCKRDLPGLSPDELKRLISNAKRELLRRKKAPHRPRVEAERLRTASGLHLPLTRMGFSSAQADALTAMILATSPQTVGRYRSALLKKPKKS